MTISSATTVTAGRLPVELPSWSETVTGFCNAKPVKMAKILRDGAAWLSLLDKTCDLSADRVIDLKSMHSGLKAGCNALAIVDVIPQASDLTKSVKNAMSTGSEWRSNDATGLQLTSSVLDVAKRSAMLTETTLKTAKFLDGVKAIDLGDSVPLLSRVKDVAGMYACAHSFVESSSALYTDMQSEAWTREETLSARNKMLDMVKFVSGFALNLLSVLAAVAGVVTASPLLLTLSSVGLATAFFKYVNDQEVRAIREAAV